MDAYAIGLRRQIKSMSRGDKNKNGMAGSELAVQHYGHMVGAAAEKAFALMIDRTFHGHHDVNKTKPDVGKQWQVRWGGFDKASLIFRKDDLDDFKYALITGEGFEYTFRGWIDGKNCRFKEWLADPGNKGEQYFIPQHALSLELPEIL
jgi:hypothetical protein